MGSHKMETASEFWSWQIWTLDSEQLGFWGQMIQVAQTVGELNLSKEVIDQFPSVLREQSSRPPVIFPEIEDYVLALAIQKGFFANEAFETLYERWWPEWNSYYSRQLKKKLQWSSQDRTGVDPTVDDLISRLITNLWRAGFKSYDGLRPLSHYLWTAAKHELLTYFRQNKVQTQLLGNFVAADGENYGPSAAHVIDAARAEMTERERQVWDLKWEGLSNAEIAERLKLTKKAVEMIAFRAAEKVRRKLAELSESEPEPAPPVVKDAKLSSDGQLIVPVQCLTPRGSHVAILLEPSSASSPPATSIRSRREIVEFRFAAGDCARISITPIASLNSTPKKLERKIKQNELEGLLVGQPYVYERS